MNKRVVPLLLVCCLFCSCLIVPARATESGDTQQLLNVLEFDTVNGSGSFSMIANADGTATASFKLPYETILRYVDMYVSTNNHVISSVSWVINGVEFPLTVESVYGNTYYRIYGQVSGGYTDEVVLRFTWADAGQWRLQFYSLYVSAQAYSAYSSASTFMLEDQSAVQAYGNSTVTLEANVSGSSTTAGVFTSSVRNSDWQKYDYMAFTVTFAAASLNTITVQIDGVAVPYDVSYIEGSLADYNGSWAESSGAGAAETYYNMTIRVDLTGQNRTKTQDLIVNFEGTGWYVYGTLHKGVGMTLADLPEAEVTWLQKIWNGLTDGFQSVVDALQGDTAASDEFNDAVQGELDELDKGQEALDSIVLPDVEDAGLGAGSGVMENPNVAAGVQVFGSVFNAIYDGYFMILFAFGIILSIIGYLLYGKR